jgi:putative FmdB family regulatory protein
MPTYEYRCENCNYEFEQFQSITAEPLHECPQCKGKVKRLIGGGGGLIFKGSGFYTTDYRSKSYQDKAKSDGGSGSSSTSKEAAKTTSDSSSKSS